MGLGGGKMNTQAVLLVALVALLGAATLGYQVSSGANGAPLIEQQ